MKKLFFAGVVAVSLVAVAATPVKKVNNSPLVDLAYYQDTIPKDTTKKPIPDSLGIAYSNVASYDTVPKKDTTKQPIPDSIALVYNR